MTTDKKYTEISSKIINGCVGGELLSSLLAVCSVTVAFCSNIIMIQDKYLELKSKKEDIDTLIELASEEEESLDDEIELSIKEFDKELSEFEVLVLLNGKYDNCNAIIEIHPGAGGTESMDWAEMLFRMYQRYAQKKGFKFETLDYLPGDEAGIKSVTFLVKGKNAYG